MSYNKRRVVWICLIVVGIMAVGSVLPQYSYANTSENKPMPPNTLKVSLKGKSSAYLRWSSAEKAEGYILYRYNQSKKKYVKIKTLKKNQKKLTVNRLPRNATVKFRVKSYNNENGKQILSNYSHTVSIRTGAKNKSKNVKNVKFNKSKMTLKKGKTTRLKAKVSPSLAKNQKLIWKSSNPNVASVSGKGTVKAKRGGMTVITARSHNGFIAKCKVTVPQKVKSIQFKASNKQTLEYGEKVKLSVQIFPADANNKRVTWKSSSKSTATVDSEGVVTALRPGKVIITAKSGKKAASLAIEIIAKKGFLTKNSLDSLNLGNTKKVMIVAHPDDETLWGGSHLLSDDYLVVCMTNAWNDTRRNEFYTALKKSGDKGIILKYPDLTNKQKDDWSGVQEALKKDLQLLLSYRDWDEIVTHNPEGEYGHIHHRLTNRAVTKQCEANLTENSLVYFGKYYTENSLKWLLSNPDLEEAQSSLANLEPLNRESLKVKQTMVDGYVSQQKGAIAAFKHMVPYENWRTYEQWNTRIK